MKGEVVVVPFPFSDLSASKRRPALVVANLRGEDIILCQITSIAKKDEYSISLKSSDFEEGKLGVESTIKPQRIFTADKSLILYKIGRIYHKKAKEVEDKIVDIIRK